MHLAAPELPSSEEEAAASERPTAAPDFGPRGYLPERAAKRARKIILREQMGLQWPIAAVVAAVVVLIAGGLYLAFGTKPPAAPFAPVARIESVDPRGAAVLPAGASQGQDLEAPRSDLLVVRAGGGVRTFLAAEGISWCAQSDRLESDRGEVWTSTGRLVSAGGESLTPVPSQVYDGVLYVDETSPGSPLPPDNRQETPACSGAP